MTVSRALSRIIDACEDGYKVKLSQFKGSYLCEVIDVANNIEAVESARDIDAAVSGAIGMMLRYKEIEIARGRAGGGEQKEPYA